MAACSLLLVIAQGGGRAGGVIDRIVATVGHRAIMQSELDESLRFQYLMDARTPDSLSLEDRRQALDRMIDQELLIEQIEQTGFPGSTPAEVANRLKELRAHNPAWASDSDWRATLERYGLTEADAEEHVARQLDLLRFVDHRFRPSIRIDTRSIEDYYINHFVPELHRAGAREVPLKEVSAKIEEILVQQRMDELLSSWLQTLRLETEVRVR